MSDELPNSTPTTDATAGTQSADKAVTDGNDHGTPAGDGSNIPTTGVEGKVLQPPSWPVIGGLVAAVAAALWLIRMVLPSRKPTPDERLAEASHALGAAAVGLGGRAAKRAALVTERAASASEPVVRDAASHATDLAQVAAARATDVAQDAAAFAAEEAKKVAAVAAGGLHEVAEGVEAVQRAWGKFVTRLIVVVFGGAGYVLGARAGRQRYEQIISAAQRAQGAVQGARH